MEVQDVGARLLRAGQLGPQTREQLRKAIDKASMEFEATFAKQMVAVAREASSGDALFGDDPAADYVADMQDTALANALAGSRTLGVARLLARQLTARALGAPRSETGGPVPAVALATGEHRSTGQLTEPSTRLKTPAEPTTRVTPPPRR